MRVRSGPSARWRQLPPGLKDLAPEEAEQRAALLAALGAEFRRWGYREVVTPALEYLETIGRGAGPGIQDQLFKIIDSGGELLALRPDMTVPIARLAATRMLPAASGPLRLMYAAEVFRGQEPGRGRLRAFTQAGVELLGDPTLEGDAEVIALAVECLGRSGLNEAFVNVGHLGLLGDLLAALPPGEREDVRLRLYRKDFVGIEDAVGDGALARLLRMLPDLHGPAALVRAGALSASPQSQVALSDLQGVMERLRAYSVADRVRVDLSIIRDFDYYTGIVFEAYASGTGYPLLGGGRYDGLLGRFGVDAPATGFAMGVERLMAAMAPAAGSFADLLLTADGTNRTQVVRLARELRQLGKRVILALDVTWPEGIRRALAEGIPLAARVEDSEVRVWDVRTGREHSVPPRVLVAMLASPPLREVRLWSH